MILLYLDQLETGDIINVPVVGLARLTSIQTNLALDGSRAGLRYFFSELSSDQIIASLPDSGCYEPVLFFSPFETLERLAL